MSPIRTTLALCVMLSPAFAQDADPESSSPIAKVVGDKAIVFTEIAPDGLSVRRLLSAPILSGDVRIGVVSDVLIGPGETVTLVIDRGSEIAEGARNRLALPLTEATVESTDENRLRIVTAQDPASLDTAQ